MREHILAVAVLAALVTLCLSPILVNPGQRFPGGVGDFFIDTSWVHWKAKAFFTEPWNLYRDPIFYPHKQAGTFHYSMLNIAIALYGPFYLLTGDPILSGNLTIFAILFLNSVASYLLLRLFIRNVYAALYLAIGLGLAPLYFYHLPHYNVITLFFGLFSLYFALRWVKYRYQAYFWCHIGFLLFQLTAPSYESTFWFIAFIFFYIYLLLTHRPFLLNQWKILLTVSVASFLVLLPFYVPYFASLEQGYVRSIAAAEQRHSDLGNFLEMPPTHSSDALGWLVGEGVPSMSWRSASVGAVDYGLFVAAIVLFAVPWFRARMTSLEKGLAVWCLLLYVYYSSLTLGTHVRLNGESYFTNIPFVISYQLPIFTQIRGIQAFHLFNNVFFYLFIGIILGSGLLLLGKIPGRNVRYGILIGVGAVMFMGIIEKFPDRLGAYHVTPQQVAQPRKTVLAQRPVYYWLGDQPWARVIIEYPFTKWPWDYSYMYYQTIHGKPMPNGISGHFPPEYHEAMQAMQGFPDQASRQYLTEHGIDAILVHKPYLSPSEVDAVLAEISKHDEWLQIEKTLAGVVVIRVKPAPGETAGPPAQEPPGPLQLGE